MQFIKNLLRNLGLLILIFFVLYLINRDIFSQIYELLGALFGPVLIAILIVAALPRRRRRRS